MATSEHRTEGIPLGTDGRAAEPYSPFVMPLNAQELCSWLDEQPGFIEGQKTYTLVRYNPYGDEDSHLTTKRSSTSRRATVVAEREQTILFHADESYDTTTRASHDSQGDVRDAWEDMVFPAHNIAYEDGKRGAELYTLSSYQTGVDGPTVSTWGRLRGGPQDRPGVEFRCSECGHTSQTVDPNSWRSGEKDARCNVDNHIQDAHDGDAHLRRVEGHRTTESEKNFYAVQFVDGSGKLVHYDTVAGIRSKHGVVLRNRQDFANGRARVTPPSKEARDAYIPLSGLMESDLLGEETVYDITEVESYEVQRWRENTVLFLDSGAAILVVYDSTAMDYDNRWCATRLEPGQASTVRRSDNPLDVVKPDIVLSAEADGADIVTSDEWGGNGSPWRDARCGDAIVRQGEWYFVPMSEDFSPDAPVYRPHCGRFDVGTVPNSSLHDSVRSECWECGATDFEIPEGATQVCTECGNQHVIRDWMDGSVAPMSPEVDGVPDIGNHKPREIAVVNGEVYVRGTVRHVESEHAMLHLEDRWHRAVENELDFVVFDTSTPDRAGGRSGGGIARVE